MAYYTGVIAQIKLGDSASPTDILAQMHKLFNRQTIRIR